MRRISLVVAAILLPGSLLTGMLLNGCAPAEAPANLSQPAASPPLSPTSRAVDKPRWDHDWRAAFHPHGETICASGCAASHHPTDELTRSRCAELLTEFGKSPIAEESLALETLLYYGPQTRKLLEQSGLPELDAARDRLLRKELQKSAVRIAIRVLDLEARQRAQLPSTQVPLDRRHVFLLESTELRSLIASGTVKRVGLRHLWTRL